MNIVTVGSGNTDDIDAIDKAKRGQRGRSMLVSGTREDENVTSEEENSDERGSLRTQPEFEALIKAFK